MAEFYIQKIDPNKTPLSYRLHEKAPFIIFYATGGKLPRVVDVAATLEDARRTAMRYCHEVLHSDACYVSEVE